MEIVFFFLANTFAGLFQGAVGFGQGLVAIPLSMLVLDKNVVLSAMMVMGAFLNCLLAIKIKEPVEKKKFWPLLISSLVGTPIGIYILKIISIGLMRIIAGGLSIIFAMLILFIKFKLNDVKRLAPGVGFIAGILQTSIGMPGPPVVILLVSSRTPKHVMRKILATYFLSLSIITIPLYMASGIFVGRGALYGFGALPFIYLAGHFGNKIAHLIPQKKYKLVVLGTVLATGFVAIRSGLQELIKIGA